MATKFERQPTHIDGFVLRKEGDKDLQLGKGEIRRLSTVTRRYGRDYRRIKDLKLRQAEDHKKIVTKAEEQGIRGAESSQDNLALNVFPVPSRIYDIDKLKQDMGDAYPTVIHEGLEVTIAILPGVNYESVVGAVRSVIQATTNPEDVEKIITVKRAPRVDEAELQQMIDSGKVELSEGTMTETESWTVTVDPLYKQKVIKGTPPKLPNIL